jgi:hypothetical protein
MNPYQSLQTPNRIDPPDPLPDDPRTDIRWVVLTELLIVGCWLIYVVAKEFLMPIAFS